MRFDKIISLPACPGFFFFGMKREPQIYFILALLQERSCNILYAESMNVVNIGTHKIVISKFKRGGQYNQNFVEKM